MPRHLNAVPVTLLAVLAAGCSSIDAPVSMPVNESQSQSAAPVSYDLLPFDVPAEMGSYTSAFGNNNAGAIVGNYAAASDGSAHGFVYQRGVFTDVVVPGSGPGDHGTLGDINDVGVAVGGFVDESDNGHMYVRAADGGITVLPNIGGAVFAEAQGINNPGKIVGFFIDGTGRRHAFSRGSGGYETYDYPGAQRVVFTGINDLDEIVGYWTDSAGHLRGFVLHRGATRAIDVPGAVNTRPSGISNDGEVTGYYRGGDGVLHGFVYQGGAYTSIDYPGAFNTTAFGVNNKGVFVGTYDDFSRGFVAVPVRRQFNG